MTSPATKARAAAHHFEAKKTGFGQAQDGWSLTLRVQHNDLPSSVKDARKGTRYMVALVEIGDDEQPINRTSEASADVRGVRGEQVGPAIETLPRLSSVQGTSELSAPRPVSVQALPDGTDDIPEFLDRRPKSPAQIAGYLCTTRSFQLFLQEKFPAPWKHGRDVCGYDPHENAAAIVRTHCKVTSRSKITADNPGWSDIKLGYGLWQNHPELEDA